MLFYFSQVALGYPPQLVQFINQHASSSELLLEAQPNVQSHLIAQIPGRVCVIDRGYFLSPVPVYRQVPIRDNAGKVTMYMPSEVGLVWTGMAGTLQATQTRDIGVGELVIYVVFDSGLRGFTPVSALRSGDC